MGLTGWLVRSTPVRPLIVAVPGGTTARFAVERFCRERDWIPATSPAGANVFIVCGPAAPIAEHVEAVWQQIPFPKARIGFVDADVRPDDVAAGLAGTVQALRDPAVQRHGAATAEHAGHAAGARTGQVPAEEPPPERDHHGHTREANGQQHHAAADEVGTDAEPHPGAVHGSDGEHGNQGTHTESATHGGHAEHGTHGGHGGHGGHDRHGGHGGHGGHDMSMMELPGGIPMADRAPDRDGLMLDRLTVVLGPVLPDWPEGMVIRLGVQGDVVQEAAPSWIVPPVEVGTPSFDPAAVLLDGIARLLAVVGWPAAAAQARWIRDDRLAGVDPASLAARYARLARRLRRSRALRWLTAGVGPLDAEFGALAGDAAERLGRWLDTVEALLAGRSPEDRPVGTEAAFAAVERLLPGQEFAVARLIVASLDPRPVPTHAGRHDG